MSNYVSPIGLGLPFFQTDMLHRRDHSPGLTVDQLLPPPSFAIQTTASATATESPRTFPDVSIHVISLRAESTTNDVSLPKSPALVPVSFAIDAAVIAGSVSILMGIACLAGIFYYRKKLHAKKKNDFLIVQNINGITTTVKGSAADDMEARPEPPTLVVPQEASTPQSQQSIRLATSKVDSTPSLLSSTAKTIPSFSTSLLIRTDNSQQVSSTVSTMSSAPFGAINAFSSHFLPQFGPAISASSGLGCRREADIGSVVLSSLRTNKDFKTLESYNDDHLTFCLEPSRISNPDVLIDKFCTSSSSSPCLADGKPLVQDIALSRTQSTLSTSSSYSASGTQSLDSLDTPSLATSDSLECFQSRTFSLGREPLLVSPSDPADPSPRLLELSLDSEVDLRSWLSLATADVVPAETSDSESRYVDMPVMPQLVTTDSQDTITGTDESFDGNFCVETPSDGLYGLMRNNGYPLLPIVLEELPQPESEVSSCEYVVASSSDLVPSDSLPPRTANLLQPKLSIPENQAQSRTLTPSASFASSSASVTTLRLPSFQSHVRPLTEEVLPPPSIIVSVPTDGSLIVPPGYEESNPDSEARIKRDGNGEIIARVVYDPMDEIEDEAWGDAYERTCFVEASQSIHGFGNLEAPREFSESWMMSSSESSELDIERAIAKFPLPPTLASLESQLFGQC
ncbi:hypothetical protein K439DRAFT_1633969 [Ramaria rubella]|nr:hypothetical protein K439DRAFT_1633969 [Ramaria rubella]